MNNTSVIINRTPLKLRMGVETSKSVVVIKKNTF